MLTTTLQRPLVIIISTMLTNHYYELGLIKAKANMFECYDFLTFICSFSACCCGPSQDDIIEVDGAPQNLLVILLYI